MSTNLFEEKLEARTKKSRAMYEEAKQVLPGGVAGNGKFMLPYPLYFREAQGAKIVDVDGNEYVDLIMGLGIHILGHSPSPVVEAVREHLRPGTMPGLATELEVQLAHKVQQHIPAVEMIRFVNTGSEATLMAIRVARAYRQRDKIARFEGNYNGQHDLVQVSGTTTAGPDDAPQPSPDCLGIPASILQDLLILPYNNIERAVSLITAHADELAGVIMEPVSIYGLGCVPAGREFMKAIREVTSRHDIPLIFDEVVTNFRLGLGGASEYYGIIPDLVCLGKIVGGGFPIGGYGGRRDLMDRFLTPARERSEKVFQSGTFSGNVISMAAGLAMIKELEKGEIYPYVNELGEKVRSGLKDIAENLGVQMFVAGVQSLFQVHFGIDDIKNVRDKMRADKSQATDFSQGLLANGIYAPAHPLYLSAAHTQQDVDRILEVAETVLREMKRAPMTHPTLSPPVAR
jgi:glutamate-1-semialdehyde 2,1-aminomutase